MFTLVAADPSEPSLPPVRSSPETGELVFDENGNEVKQPEKKRGAGVLAMALARAHLNKNSGGSYNRVVGRVS